MRRRPAKLCARGLTLGVATWTALAGAVRAEAPPLPLVARAAAGATYRVDTIAGSALAWIPWQGQWTTLRTGLRLPVGSLIQCLGATTLELHEVGAATAKDRAPLKLNLSQPGMFRLYPDLGRQIRLIESVGVKAEDVSSASVASGKVVEKPLYRFEDSWLRERGVDLFLKDLKKLTSDALKPLIFQNSASVTPIHMRNMVHDVELKYPQDGMVFFRGNVAESILVSWRVAQEPSAHPWLDVFVWKRGGERGEPLASTNSDALPVAINERGGYFVQLSSPDRRYQSRPIYFVVE